MPTDGFSIQSDAFLFSGKTKIRIVFILSDELREFIS